jgi:hypothetical protein
VKPAIAATLAPHQALKRFAEARAKYKPRDARCVLVAESPPKAESERFFYFEAVAKGDSLFWESCVQTECVRAIMSHFRATKFTARYTHT